MRPSAQHVVAVAALLVGLTPAACGRSSSNTGSTTGATSTVVTTPTVTLSSPRDSVERALSHFACYPIENGQGNMPGGVTLKDQFSKTFLAVTNPTKDELCAPVSKNGGARADTVTHLLCYRATVQTRRMDVWITNQFDSVAKLRVDRARAVCVPSNKSRNKDRPPQLPGAGVDHFLCYSVLGGGDVNRTVTLDDQFGKKEKLVGRAIRLCNPTEKRVSGQPKASIAHRRAHLTCYSMSGVEKPDTATVWYRNQFNSGTAVLRLDPRILCVPSVKDTIDPATATQTPKG